MGLLLVYTFIFLLIIGVVLFFAASRGIKKAGLPKGQVIYSDSRQWEPVNSALYDRNIGLCGRPDYIVKHNKMLIPIEVKSSKISVPPHASHIFQLAAYCRLIEDHYQVRPPYGILNYPNQTVRIPYTKDLENQLLKLIKNMQSDVDFDQINRSHQSLQRCLKCGYSSSCDQQLT